MRKLILLAAVAVPFSAQQPHIQNGTSHVASSMNPAAEVHSLETSRTTTWLAYTVPTTRSVQSGSSPNDIVYLEGDRKRSALPEHDQNKESHRALVLLRITQGGIQNLRVEDPERTLDAGGTRVAFLPNVDPAQSVELFKSLAESATSNHVRDAAVFALSIHQTKQTAPALTALASPDHDLQLREKAAFWLSSQYAASALKLIDEWLRSDKDDRFREKLTFDLTMIHEGASVDILIRTARTDTSPQVRKQAQFWMASIATKRVAETLGDAVEHDSDPGVRNAAVFGLSRLPNGEGTTRLIDLVRTTRDPLVRKQAVFWFGQSSDPRALDYIVQLVRH